MSVYELCELYATRKCEREKREIGKFEVKIEIVKREKNNGKC